MIKFRQMKQVQHHVSPQSFPVQETDLSFSLVKVGDRVICKIFETSLLFPLFFLFQGQAVRRERAVVQPNPALPHIHQEPAMLFCVGLLLLLVGRIIFLQGNMHSEDHSQV